MAESLDSGWDNIVYESVVGNKEFDRKLAEQAKENEGTSWRVIGVSPNRILQWFFLTIDPSVFT